MQEQPLEPAKSDIYSEG